MEPNLSPRPSTSKAALVELAASLELQRAQDSQQSNSQLLPGENPRGTDSEMDSSNYDEYVDSAVNVLKKLKEELITKDNLLKNTQLQAQEEIKSMNGLVAALRALIVEKNEEISKLKELKSTQFYKKFNEFLEMSRDLLRSADGDPKKPEPEISQPDVEKPILSNTAGLSSAYLTDLANLADAGAVCPSSANNGSSSDKEADGVQEKKRRVGD